MAHPPIVSTTLALIWGCLNSADPLACQVQLQVQNRATFTILEVDYRQSASNIWNDTSISRDHPLNYNENRIIGWDGDGDYKIRVIFSSAPTKPVVTETPDICGMGQVIVSNNNINFR